MMSQEPTTEQQLLAWAAAIIERERDRSTSGAVRVEMQNGVIQRVRVEAVEKAPAVDREVTNR